MTTLPVPRRSPPSWPGVPPWPVPRPRLGTCTFGRGGSLHRFDPGQTGRTSTWAHPTQWPKQQPCRINRESGTTQRGTSFGRRHLHQAQRSMAQVGCGRASGGEVELIRKWRASSGQVDPTVLQDPSSRVGHERCGHGTMCGPRPPLSEDPSSCHTHVAHTHGAGHADAEEAADPDPDHLQVYNIPGSPEGLPGRCYKLCIARSAVVLRDVPCDDRCYVVRCVFPRQVCIQRAWRLPNLGTTGG
jgi:hypothetical protein